MEALLREERSKITSRAFRPALPFKLTRERASEDKIQALGSVRLQNVICKGGQMIGGDNC